ncbi:MAG TPA: hypothetical protein DCM86_15535, partial [Verrucomicrobiales bacterium]|nr:hypothetical protein [Verrucomicrobiales bacterium]
GVRGFLKFIILGGLLFLGLWWVGGRRGASRGAGGNPAGIVVSVPDAAEGVKAADTLELPDLSGVVGEADNPKLTFAPPAWALPFHPLALKVTSSDPQVIRHADITAAPVGTNLVSLTLVPSGVGYARIKLTLLDLADGLHVFRYTFHYAASTMGRPGGRWHTGASDASAAVAISTGLMLVGDDEDQVLRLYRRGESGPPLQGFDITPFLGLTDLHHNGRPKEVDIEAVTQVGRRLFWLGSQSHDREGLPAANRSRVFATDLEGSGDQVHPRFVGRYDFLLQDLIAWDAGNGHGMGSNYFGLSASTTPGLSSKDPGGQGYVIEGLCRIPGSSEGAWLGFRAPLVPPSRRWSALVVPVTNFFSLAVSGSGAGATRFGVPMLLDLGGRGIRDMVAGDRGVLILAGPPGHDAPNLPHDSSLFTWDGNLSHPPQRREASLGGLRPEAIVEIPPEPWGPETVVELLSDNGTTEFYGDGVPAKSLHNPAFKKFRSDPVKLGGVLENVTP